MVLSERGGQSYSGEHDKGERGAQGGMLGKGESFEGRLSRR